MVEPVVDPYHETHIQDTGYDWDNGIIPTAASLGPTYAGLADCAP